MTKRTEQPLSREDRDALATCDALRAALGEQLERGAGDILSLALHLGRLLAIHRGSSTALTQLVDEHATSGTPVRAALVEGFARGREELSRSEALSRMHAPIVCVGPDTYAVFCAYEPDDDVDLSEWADEMARDLRKRGAKFAVVAGAPLATAKVREAAALVGIHEPPAESATTSAPHGGHETAPRTSSGWRRFWPFRGGGRTE